MRYPQCHVCRHDIHGLFVEPHNGAVWRKEGEVIDSDSPIICESCADDMKYCPHCDRLCGYDCFVGAEDTLDDIGCVACVEECSPEPAPTLEPTKPQLRREGWE
jgi:hypothetical protein